MSVRQIGPYRVIEQLGEKYLYKAEGADGREVVVKVLPAWQRWSEAVARFEREIRISQSIQHENVARFLDLGTARVDDPELVIGEGEDRVYFFVREFVPGRSVEKRMAGRRLPLPLVLNVAIQAARGLGALHREDVVHRNLNPRNVIVDDEGAVKLVDFGLIKTLRDELNEEIGFKTEVGLMLGTAGYMAPEQLEAKPLDARSDLFSLGVLIYEMVTGSPPFPTDDLLEHFHALRSLEPSPMASRREEVPAELDRVVLRLLSKRPEGRYQSAEDLEQDLIACLHAEGV